MSSLDKQLLKNTYIKNIFDFGGITINNHFTPMTNETENITKKEASFIFKTFTDYNAPLLNVLEIGLGLGILTIIVLNSVIHNKNTTCNYFIIDDNQIAEWKSNGVKNIQNFLTEENAENITCKLINSKTINTARKYNYIIINNINDNGQLPNINFIESVFVNDTILIVIAKTHKMKLWIENIKKITGIVSVASYEDVSVFAKSNKIKGGNDNIVQTSTKYFYEKWICLNKCLTMEKNNLFLQHATAIYSSNNLCDYFQKQKQLIINHGIIYDPINNCFRQYNAQIDMELDYLNDERNKKIINWIGFRPLKGIITEQSIKPNTGMQPNNAKLSSTSANESPIYSLRILNPKTTKYQSTTNLLSKHCIRRFQNTIDEPFILKTIGIIIVGTTEIIKSKAYNIATCSVDGNEINKACIMLLHQNVDCILIINKQSLENSLENALEKSIKITDTTITDFLNDIHFDNTIIPAYPIIYANTKCILFTSIQLMQINGVGNECKTINSIIQSFLSRISYALGAILICGNEIHLPEINETETYYVDGIANCFTEHDKELYLYNNFEDGRVISIDCKNITHESAIAKHIPWCQHGWCGYDTHLMLLLAITAFKPKNIIELGTWYGASIRYILQNCQSNATVYSVDYFKNVCINGNKQESLVPEDKMFYNFIRFESIISSVESFALNNLTHASKFITMKMDIAEGVDFLHEHGVDIDMVFIDAEKKTKPLISLILKIRSYYPNAVIVGDDNVYQSVKDAVKQLKDNHRCKIIERHGSYLVLPKSITEIGETYKIYTQLQNTYKQFPYEKLYGKIHSYVYNKDIDNITNLIQSYIESNKSGELFVFVDANGKTNDGIIPSAENPLRCVSVMFMLCHAFVEFAKVIEKDKVFAKKMVKIICKCMALIDDENKIWLSSSTITPFDLLINGINFE